MRYIGLISGTSMDGIDVAIVEIGSNPSFPTLTLIEGCTQPFDAELMRSLVDAKRWAETDHRALIGSALHQTLDQALAEAFAQACHRLLSSTGIDASSIDAIGSHGQTLVHRPDERPAISLQLGDPQRIATLTGITTVGQFRQNDLLAGGQGAPLAPLLHQHLFMHPSQSTGVLNLGGIANLTVLRPSEPVVGFDTGPANALLDAWFAHHHGHGFDVSGAWAASGQVNEDWVAEALTDPYFMKPPPKSTSIESFGLAWLNQQLAKQPSMRPEDVQASLAAITAKSIALAVASVGHLDRLILCGGGAHNLDLVGRLKSALPNTDVFSSEALGISADHLEAMLFAWLAHQRLAGISLDTTSITGADHPVLLGEVYHP